MSKIDIIIEYLLTEKTGLTVRSCQEMFGTTELRKRICDIKDKGYEVKDVWEVGEDRFGNPTRYKRYFITGRAKRKDIPGFEQTMEKFDNMINWIRG